jgi:outer membrane lipoprotein-sorting protein
MTRHLSLITALTLSIAGCADVWAQSIARKVARDLGKIEGYSGRVVERGYAGGEVVSDVIYARPGKLRLEVKSPAARAGELFIADGDRVIMWWPQALFGVEVRGVSTPKPSELREHIERLTRSSLAAYAFSLRGESQKIAGERAKEWRVVPTRRHRYRFRHDAWTHARYSLPLKLELRDGARLWYGMEYTRLDFTERAGADRFAFEFPANAIVMRWDLGGASLTPAEAKAQMNFDVKLAADLPRGHKINRIVRAKHCIPSIVIDMSRGATALSLTESRDLGLAAPARGKAIEINGRPAQLAFLGPFSTITWVHGTTLLTLTGNLAYPEMIAVAESVK